MPDNVKIYGRWLAQYFARASFDWLLYNSVIIFRYFGVGYLIRLCFPFAARIARNYFCPKSVSFFNIDKDPVLLHLNDFLIVLSEALMMLGRQL